MARPIDSWEVVYWNFAPHDVMFSGWVGDQLPTWEGMQHSLRNMFHSSWQGFLNFGSDTGGYLRGNNTKDVFVRWVQLSAFCPLFEVTFSRHLISERRKWETWSVGIRRGDSEYLSHLCKLSHGLESLFAVHRNRILSQKEKCHSTIGIRNNLHS